MLRTHFIGEIFLLLISIFYAGLLHGKTLHVQQFSTDHGLSNASVTSIIQDKQGYIWVGTEFGLNRFDGYQFKHYYKSWDKQTINNLTFVSNLFLDNDSNLWVASDGVLAYDQAIDRFVNQRVSIDSVQQNYNNRYNCITQDKLNRFWVASYGGIKLIDRSNERITSVSSKEIITIIPETITQLMEMKVPAEIVAAAASFLNKSFNSEKNLFDVINVLVNKEVLQEHFSALLNLCKRESDPNAPMNNYVKMVSVDHDGAIWIVYTQNGLSRIDPRSFEYKHYEYVVDNRLNPGDLINHILIDENKVWIATTQEGLKVLDLKTNELKKININNETYLYHLMKNGNLLWISTNRGLYTYDIEKQSVQCISFEQAWNRQLTKSVVRSTFIDNHKNLWIATEHHGLLLADSRKNFYSFDEHLYASRESQNAICRAVAIDNNGNTWVGYSDGNLEIFNKNGTSRLIARNTKFQDIHTIWFDGENHVWVGSYLGGLEKYNLNGQLVKHYTHENTAGYRLPANDVRDIDADNNGNIYVAIHGKGFVVIDKNNGKVVFTSKSFDELGNQLPFIWVWSILVDINNQVWLAGSTGLTRYNVSDSSFKHFIFGSEQTSNSSIRSIAEDRNGLIWLSTEYGILAFNPKNESSLRITEENGLSSNLTTAVISDHNGNLWASTMNGLNLIRNVNNWMNLKGNFDTINVQLSQQNISRFFKSDGLLSDHFLFNAVNSDKKDWLYFGTSYGLVFFHPDSIHTSYFKPPVYIQSVAISNRKLEVNDQTGLLTKNIDIQKSIELNYHQNAISFQYAALNFINSSKNLYAYKLEGFDKEWNYVGDKREANYTNLPPGRYLFKVKATNNDGLWSNREAAFAVHIKPPLWLTKWAMLLYILFFAAIVFIFQYILVIKANARFKIQRMQEIDALKSRFFTNVAHEIRTPLLLISAPLEKLINSRENFDWKNDYFQIHLMHRNVKRLHKLVNQFLDFKKIDTGHYKLGVVAGDIIAFVSEISRTFQSMANDKNISFSFNNINCENAAWFDPEIIETVLTNLLSNAIKFTPENGNIKVELKLNKQSEKFQDNFYAKEFISISVIDSGPGIPPEMRNSIFDCYTQIHINRNKQFKGSGIGLSIVKEMVELHKGKISITSTDPNDYSQGSNFTLYIPFGEDYYYGAILSDSSNVLIKKPDQFFNNNESDKVEFASLNNDELLMDAPTLLVVEDNDDIRTFLFKSLSGKYHMFVAETAEDGLKIAREKIPDLIVLDIVLPGMDGIELCKTLKSEIETDHIPIILLTAQVDDADRYSGFLSGADAYMTKPFSLEELLVRVRNLIETRQKLIEKFSSDLISKPLNQLRVSSEGIFLKKAIDIIQNNLSNPNLDVKLLTDELGMSRAQLYRKFNAVTKQPVKEFVRAIRLKKAAELLLDEDLNITSVAYTVGFGDLPYFTRCFKATYGVTPSTYIKNNRSKNPNLPS